MSWRHIEALVALPDADLPPATARCVLVSLAHHANNYTGTCWPSVARLQKITGLGESTIRRSIDQLIDLGFIIRTAIPGKVSRYAVMIEGAGTIDGYDPPAPKAHPSRSGTTPLPEGEDTPPGAGPERGRKDIKRLAGADARADIADDWKPSPARMAALERRYPGVDIDNQIEAFILKCRSNGTVHKDIDAAFESWMLRLKDLRMPPKARAPAVRAVPVDPAAVARATEVDAVSMKARGQIDEATEKMIEAARLWLGLKDPAEARRCAVLARGYARPGSWFDDQVTVLEKDLPDAPLPGLID